MRKNSNVASNWSPIEAYEFNPLDFVQMAGENPSFSFKWGDPKEKTGKKRPVNQKGKRRMICRPNTAMRKLHALFEQYLLAKIETMDKKDTYGIRKLPSATGCVKGSNPLLNAKRHEHGEFFYITDFAHAYPSVDLRRLAILLVFIEKYDYYKVDYAIDRFARNEIAHYVLSCDPLFQKMEGFVQIAFGGFRGEGLAVGGTLSPYLLNLYCEVFLDQRLRYHFFKLEDKREPEKNVVYTRYVDDLVFSGGKCFFKKTRDDIRRMISDAGFEVKHRKSFVLKRSKSAVFVTKIGMRTELVTTKNGGKVLQKSIIVFPQKKRRRVNGILQSYLKFRKNSPEVVSGVIAEFIYYYKNVDTPTASDEKTMALCREFEKVAGPYLKNLHEAIANRRKEKAKRP